ncbi:7 transmembrane receptor (rhodopsin family) [Popillia japonica]|uniref:7 transmembrane receptor (Rhodopsin family) n=1 Tax=Popillia japonica TaxID=7064 RepID=A0AAW1JFU6_POPJA
MADNTINNHVAIIHLRKRYDVNVGNVGEPTKMQTSSTNGESKSLQNFLPNPNSSQNVLKARRGVIRMLIIVVLTFALCNLPLHARKMWQYWSPHYRGDTRFSALFTPLTFLVTYFNSGINPLLYAFLSRNFRRSVSVIRNV